MALRLSLTRQLSYGNYYRMLLKTPQHYLNLRKKKKHTAQIIALAVYVKLKISKTLATLISQIPSP